MKPIPTWRQIAVGFVEEPSSVSSICMQQEIDALRQRVRELEAEKCRTCKHLKQGANKLAVVFEIDCFECKHFYASKYECDDIGGHPI